MQAINIKYVGYPRKQKEIKKMKGNSKKETSF